MHASRSLFAVVGTLFVGLVGHGCVGGDPLSTGTLQLAETLDVPAAFGSLGAALAAASPGDVIALAAGDYDGDVTIEVPQLTIVGAGAGRTVVHRSINVRADLFAISDLSMVADGAAFGIHANGWSARIERVDVRGYSFGILLADTGRPFRIDNCVIAGNQWGVYTNDTNGRITNSLILDNGKAGVFGRSNATVRVYHNTILGNGFANPGEASGGVTIGPGGTPDVRNNIIVANQAGVNCNDCSARPSHNAVWGNVEDYVGGASREAGDINVDPRFVAPGEQDFRLRPDSPCIDVGIMLGVQADADGNQRPAGDAPDLGAYEFQPITQRVIINEVLANPLVERTGEFVELVNLSDQAVDLAGYFIDDGDDLDPLVAWQGGPTRVDAGAIALLLDPDFPDADSLPADVVRLTVPDSALGNGLSIGDAVFLRLPDGNTVVSGYSNPFDPGDGVSAERETLDSERFLPSPCGSSPGRLTCEGGGVRAAQLLVTEVMSNPLHEGTGEFVELINLSEDPIDLAGFVLSDGDSTDEIVGFDGDAVVPGRGAFALIVDRDYDGDYELPNDVKLLTVGDRRLGNSLSVADPITLRAPDGTLVASFSFPFDPGNGRSAELADLDLGDVDGAWVPSRCPGLPAASPGADNCAWEPVDALPELTLRLNEVMANPLTEDTGEFVEFVNDGDAPVETAGLFLSDGDATDRLMAFDGGETVLAPGGFAVVLDPEFAGEYSLPANAVLLRPEDTTVGSGIAVDDVVTLLHLDGTTVLDRFDTPFNPGNGISAERLGEQWLASPCPLGSSPGRPNCTLGPPPPDPVGPDVVINEVMANPLDERRGEFVELFNRGDEAVDLAGWRVYDGDSTDVLVGFQGGRTLLRPGRYAVILDPDYVGGYDIGNGAVRLSVGDRAIGSGLSTRDSVTLFEPDGVTVADTYGTPFDPGNGRSAERVHPAERRFVAALCDGDQQSSPGSENCVRVGDDPRACFSNDDCGGAERCIGIPGDGSGFRGRCADMGPRDGEGEPCLDDAACGNGLICMGLTVFPDDAFCVADYQFGEYRSDERVAIPDNDAGGRATDIVVYGLATVPIDIVVTVDLDHPAHEQLRVTLTAPSGDQSVLFDSDLHDPSRLDSPIVALDGIPRDDAVNGRWRLTVSDRVAGGTGHLDGWTLQLISNWD